MWAYLSLTCLYSAVCPYSGCNIVLLIRKENRDKFPYFSIKTCCGHSLNRLVQEVLIKGHNMFSLRIMQKISQNYPDNSNLSQVSQFYYIHIHTYPTFKAHVNDIFPVEQCFKFFHIIFVKFSSVKKVKYLFIFRSRERNEYFKIWTYKLYLFSYQMFFFQLQNDSNYLN